jgi:hypothetical protein
LSRIHLQPRKAVAQVDQVNHLYERLRSMHLDIPHHGRFASVRFGHSQPFNLRPPSLDGDGQGAPNASQSSIQREFAHKEQIRHLLLLIQAAVCV